MRHGLCGWHVHAMFSHGSCQCSLMVRALESLLVEVLPPQAEDSALGNKLLYILSCCDDTNVRRRIYRWYRRVVRGTPYAAADGACPFPDPLAPIEGRLPSD